MVWATFPKEAGRLRWGWKVHQAADPAGLGGDDADGVRTRAARQAVPPDEFLHDGVHVAMLRADGVGPVAAGLALRAALRTEVSERARAATLGRRKHALPTDSSGWGLPLRCAVRCMWAWVMKMWRKGDAGFGAAATRGSGGGEREGTAASDAVASAAGGQVL